MKATLSLEIIEAAAAGKQRLLRSLAESVTPGLGGALVGRISGRPWIAEILGRDEKFGLSRRFLPANFDYKNANAVGTRGARMWFVLETGRLYQVHKRQSWRRSRRYFCTVNDEGDIVECDDEEVGQWLNARSASMS